MLYKMDTKVVKDPVYTSIQLPSDFFKLIDDPLFQRLRYIKQTGLTHLVYPGLRHSRFEHSLGVAHLMLTALEAIYRNTLHVYGENSRAFKAVKSLVEDTTLWCASGIAALLHDIGHLAWSHVFESALTDYYVIAYARSEPAILLSLSLVSHEQLTLRLALRLLAKHDRLCGVDSDTMIERVKRILDYAYGEGKPGADIDPLLIPARLLSGTVDVDRGDYLLRDSRSAGVSYGLYDVDRLISVLVAVEEPGVASKRDMPIDVGVVDKGVSVVESMLLGRMYMYSEVYLHDVVLAYEASASRLLSMLMYTASLLAEEGYPGVTGFERKLLECMTLLLSGVDEERPELDECARILTDPAIETMAELLAFNYSSIYNGLLRIEQGKWICPALYTYSRILTARQHPTGIYLSGRLANTVVTRISGPRKGPRPQDVAKILPTYIEVLQESPLITFGYTSYPIYSKNDPVLVLNRRTKRVYALHELGLSPTAELLSNVSTWSKIVITIPVDTISTPHTSLRIRRGKFAEKELMHNLQLCGYSLDEASREVAKIKEILGELLTEIEVTLNPLY